MENRHHNAGTQDRHASTAERLPANIDDAGIVAVARALRRQEVCINLLSDHKIANASLSIVLQLDCVGVSL